METADFVAIPCKRTCCSASVQPGKDCRMRSCQAPGSLLGLVNILVKPWIFENDQEKPPRIACNHDSSSTTNDHRKLDSKVPAPVQSSLACKASQERAGPWGRCGCLHAWRPRRMGIAVAATCGRVEAHHYAKSWPSARVVEECRPSSSFENGRARAQGDFFVGVAQPLA